MIIIYHIYSKNVWTEKLVDLQLQRLVNSGLYDKCSNIFCTILNNNELITNNIILKLKVYKKIIFDISNNLHLYEGATLINCQNHIKNFLGKTPILYMHTKCATKGDENRSISCYNWRNMMEYCMIDLWETCIDKLSSYDSCFPLNKGGNFFWTTCEKFLIVTQKKIEKFNNQDRFYWEFYSIGKTFNMINFNFDFHKLLQAETFHNFYSGNDDVEFINMSLSKNIKNDQIIISYIGHNTTQVNRDKT